MKRLELLLCGLFGAVSCALPAVSIDPTLGAAGSGGSVSAGGSGGTGPSGSGGSTTAGSSGSAGKGSGGPTGGSAGSGNGGSNPSGGGGVGGNGGTGMGGQPVTTYSCDGVSPPANGMIQDFSNGTGFGTADAFGGGATPYGDATGDGPDLTVDISSGAARVSGTVATYSGLVMWFFRCVDATAYSGVSFDIFGSVGASGQIEFLVQTNSNTSPDPDGMKGACTGVPYVECVEPLTTLTVNPVTTHVTLAWSELTGGLPLPTVSDNEILGLQWQFPWTETSTAYNASLTIDNVSFY